MLLSEAILRLVNSSQKIATGWLWDDSPRRSLANFKNDVPNEFGLRGQRIQYEKDDYVIVLLGDSQVEAATSTLKNMPDRLLENYLGTRLSRPVKVFSLAASGWGQDQQLIALESYFKKYRADMVLLWATPGNDFWENTFPDRSVTTEAGHIKPTYKLVGKNKIKGPFYKYKFFYKDSAILQLITIALMKEKTLEQRILGEWMTELPSPYIMDNTNTSKGLCPMVRKIDHGEFYKEIFTFSHDEQFLVITDEDYLNSRSHFAPNMINRSNRDNYMIQLTKLLFVSLKETSNRNGAIFLVFYPVREDFDYRQSFIKCIQKRELPNSTILIRIDGLLLLREVLSSDDFVFFDLPGGNELSVSSTDRHLNELGNQKAMNILVSLIANKCEQK